MLIIVNSEPDPASDEPSAAEVVLEALAERAQQVVLAVELGPAAPGLTYLFRRVTGYERGDLAVAVTGKDGAVGHYHLDRIATILAIE